MNLQQHSIKYFKEQFTNTGRMCRIVKAILYIAYFVLLGAYMANHEFLNLSTYVYVIQFIIGLLIGSFLNLCVDRIPKEEDIIFQPSHCRNCNHRLGIKDLIPIISYIILRGKCRYCHKKFKSLELGNLFIATILTALLYKYKLTFRFIQLAVLCCFLYVISIIDYQILGIYFPNIKTGFKLTLIPFLIVLIYERTSNRQLIDCNIIYDLTHNSLFKFSAMTNLLYGLLIGLGLMAILYLVTLKKALGNGDIYITGIIGLTIGHDYLIIALIMTCIVASIVGIVGILLYLSAKLINRPFKTPYKECRFRKMPLIPYLYAGTLISIFFAQNLIYFYLSL